VAAAALSLGFAAKDPDCAFQKLALSLRDLVGVDVELLR